MWGMPRTSAVNARPTSLRRNKAPKRARRSPQSTNASAATIARILDGARKVLIEDGYSAFTTRRVAAAVGITGGNLAYHFPSKRDLLRALIGKLLADYSSRFEAILTEPDAPVGDRLEALIRWLFTNAISVETVHTARELWVLALHDATVRRALDDFWDEGTKVISQLVQRARPRARALQAQELAHVITIITQGMIVLYGTGRERAVPHERAVEIVTGLVNVLLPEL